MSLLKKVKEKITTIDSYIRSNVAMKSVASVRLVKFKKKILILDEIIKLTDEFFEEETEERNITKLHVFIGCNQGMCGTFYSQISNHIKMSLKNIEEKSYYYILGEKFLDYGIYKNIVVEKIWYDYEFVNLANKIYKFILKNEITDVVMHYYAKGGKIEKKECIKCRDIYKKYCVFEMLDFVLQLSLGVYTSGFYENKERILVLEQANTNAKKIRKTANNELNRMRQDSITNDLAEIVAGVLL